MTNAAAADRLELRVDVTDAVTFGTPMLIAATVYLPDLASLRSPPTVIFAVPGGGYTRWYFDMHFDGHGSYSQAEYHTARGMIYVAYDHLGVGDSTTQHADELTVEMLADANHEMVRQVLSQLSAGIRPGFPPIARPFTVDTGQSMGGGVTILMQGRSRTFDAVAILGSVRSIRGCRKQRRKPPRRLAQPLTSREPHRCTNCRWRGRQPEFRTSSIHFTGRTCHKTYSIKTSVEVTPAQDGPRLWQPDRAGVCGCHDVPWVFHSRGSNDPRPGIDRGRRTRCLSRSVGGTRRLFKQY